MKGVDLTESQWTIEAIGDLSHVPVEIGGRALPACLPGCVHSNLIRAGVMGHPNIGDNEERCQWIGVTDWRYRCRFEVDAELLAHERVDLVLDGLDTIAVIDINGQRVSEAMNMHHAHRFDCKALLRTGENELVITLRGPVSYVEEQVRRLGKRPVNGDWLPYSYIRKMASNFQWDWGPRVATCGIWRAARLEAWSGVRVAGMRPVVSSLSADRAIVSCHVDLEWARDPSAANLSVACSTPHELLSVHVADLKSDQRAATVSIEIEKPALWWPRGCGLQGMYQLACATRDDGSDHVISRIGLRELRVNRQQDLHGEPFAIEVNGVPIFCKGANWIPEGLFPDDQSPQRIRQRVQQAADANINMLRVWGGGTYEQDAFYEACDELGIMVWQDFMFACATYPEDDPYPALIEREAREAVNRLASHPSIVLWCGGNENVLGYESWGWKQRMLRTQKWGERYFLDILPRVVAELDPSRPYWPDSPYSGSREVHPNDPDCGDRHTWDAKGEGYRDIVPRFCSEFGHQSPPCWATMRECWGEDQLHINSRATHHRQRATGGNDVWYGSKVMGGRFADSRPPNDFDEWLYQAHLLQARAISIGIEWMRANQPRCMGALFWQFNDAWAGHSWSCIDSAGRKKPLWHAVRKSFAPQLLTIQPMDGGLRLCAINDGVEPWCPAARVRRLRTTGEVLSERIEGLRVEPRTADCARSIGHMVGTPNDPRAEFIVVDVIDNEAGSEGSRALWFFEHDRVLGMPQPQFDAAIERDKDGVRLALHAHTLLRDVIIAIDRVDPGSEIDDNLFTLLPGESRTLRITTSVDAPAATWTSPPVFRCANEFSGGGRA